MIKFVFCVLYDSTLKSLAASVVRPTVNKFPVDSLGSVPGYSKEKRGRRLGRRTYLGAEQVKQE